MKKLHTKKKSFIRKSGFSAPPNLGLFPLLGRKRPKRGVIRGARGTKKSCSVCTTPSFKGGRQKSGGKCAWTIKSPLMAKKTQKNTLLSEKQQGPKKAMRGKPQSLAKITLMVSKKTLGKSRHTPAAKSIWHQAKASPVIRPKMELTNQSPKMLLHALAVLATSVRA